MRFVTHQIATSCTKGKIFISLLTIFPLPVIIRLIINFSLSLSLYRPSQIYYPEEITCNEDDLGMMQEEENETRVQHNATHHDTFPAYDQLPCYNTTDLLIILLILLILLCLKPTNIIRVFEAVYAIFFKLVRVTTNPSSIYEFFLFTGLVLQPQ